MKRIELEEKLFDMGIIIKGFDGLIEFLGGIFLLILGPSQIYYLAIRLTSHELLQDPQDLVANYLQNTATHFSVKTEIFTAIFLLSHGIIKIILVWALLKKILWAYPLAIVVFGSFLIYQTYQLIVGPSFFMAALSLLDLFVIVLTVIELRNLRHS